MLAEKAVELIRELERSSDLLPPHNVNCFFSYSASGCFILIIMIPLRKTQFARS